MLTIGQLAAYAGVTVRAVRHYHQVGLLAEPDRDASGYRTYGAADVVRLIKIRTLAEAGVPLARVQDLLEATPEQFADAVTEIDRALRARIRELQDHRRQIARLADAGDSLGVPEEVADYLEQLRAAGVSDELVGGERDGWILMAARYPERIPEMMAAKRAQLEDPRTLRMYGLIGELLEEMDEERLHLLVDLMVEMVEEADARGELDQQSQDLGDDSFVALLDSFASDSHPLLERVQELMAERGWTGWSRMEKSG